MNSRRRKILSLGDPVRCYDKRLCKLYLSSLRVDIRVYIRSIDLKISEGKKKKRKTRLYVDFFLKKRNLCYDR